jgi:ribosomal protein S24E
MELEITNKTDEPLLNRTKIEGKIKFEGATPSNVEVVKQIASELKVNENVIAIKGIYTSFGSPNAKFFAHSYKDEASKKEIEPKPKTEKKPAEEGAAEEPKAETKKEEPKPEEKKEEKPAEEPKAEEKKK